MKRALTYIGVGLAVLVLAIVLIAIFFEPTLAEWRDIMIITIGFFLLVFAVTLVGVAVATLMLVTMLRQKLPALLDKAGSTAETVRGTTGFVSERVVSPFIKVSSAASGARAAVETLVRRKDDNGRS